MRRFAHFGSLFVSFALLVTTTASAAVFSDVPTSSPYHTAIMALADAGVVTGNPDGTFRPLNPLNRVAVLKMAYKAAGREPAVSSGNCFPKEFSNDAWFATYVCDALARKFVKGYTDGTFRPNGIVTLGEALKMIYTVLEIPAPAVTAADTDALPFRLSPFHWAAPYIVSAYHQKMLPLPGQIPDAYIVDDPIDRGQAAVLVHGAMYVRSQQKELTQASSSSEASAGSSSSAASSASSISFTDATATIPWSQSAIFTGKNTQVYRFHLKEAMMVDVEAVFTKVANEFIQCRLYRLSDDSVSDEFYVGLEEGARCSLHTMLEAGKYQLELTPGVADAAFRVEVTQGSPGDGNDGLHDAIFVPQQKLRSGILAPNDLEDWYVFTVAAEDEWNIQYTSDSEIGCSVYPWADVSLPSFEFPTCNKLMLYPTGTYYVRLTHGKPRAARQTYTLIMRTK